MLKLTPVKESVIPVFVAMRKYLQLGNNVKKKAISISVLDIECQRSDNTNN